MTVKLYEWDKTETGGAWIEITDNKVVNLKLREENNLIEINEDDEAYVDLQLADGIAPDDDFPVWVTTGRVLVADWRPVAWTVTISKTTSWDYSMYLFWDDGKVYVDNGTGVWKILARPEFVTQDEYDALPQSKESDNNLYIIVDTHIPPKTITFNVSPEWWGSVQPSTVKANVWDVIHKSWNTLEFASLQSLQAHNPQIYKTVVASSESSAFQRRSIPGGETLWEYTQIEDDMTITANFFRES